MSITKVLPETGSEQRALFSCKTHCKKSVLHFRYSPKPPSRHYAESKYNICRIESNSGVKNFNQVREVFYDYLADRFHNKPQFIKS